MINIKDRRIDLKNKFRKRKQLFAAWTSLSHRSITEIFARSMVDFVGIDIEHSTISQEQSQHIISTCHGLGTVCLPRIASHNKEMVKRLLDSGADGIIAPMVSEPQEVERLLEWCKYPPQGQRSYGIARAQGYGFDFEEYIKSWNSSFIFIIQIETIQGIENIEKILSHEEIAGVMIGPYDLSGSMGIPGQLNHPDVIKACQRVIETCNRLGVACGTQLIEPDCNNIKTTFSDGYTFVVLASDIFVLWKWSDRMRGIIEDCRKLDL